jgi:hypothetical protein
VNERRLQAVLTALALAAALPGCGGGGPPAANGSTASPTPTSTVTPTTTPTKGESVGSVIKVNQRDAFIQGSPAFDEDPIHEGESVSTNDKGRVTFGLQEKIQLCRLFSNSEVVASPGGGILLRYQRGRAWCFTKADPSRRLTLSPSGVEFAMSDPLFGVSIDGERVTLRVVQGVVDVQPSASGTGGPLLVGPGQQVTVVQGNVPSGAEDFNTESLPGAERRTVSQFEAAIPPPNFDPPQPGVSPGLQRILVKNKEVRVGIDARFAGDPPSKASPDWDFTDRFFLFLADHWGISSRPLSIQPEDAASALKRGRINVFVTPEPPADFGFFPLFGGLEGRTWSVSFVAADELLGQALRDFVVASLQERDYTITYQEAFGSDHPPYEPIRSLLGL